MLAISRKLLLLSYHTILHHEFPLPSHFNTAVVRSIVYSLQSMSPTCERVLLWVSYHHNSRKIGVLCTCGRHSCSITRVIRRYSSSARYGRCCSDRSNPENWRYVQPTIVIFLYTCVCQIREPGGMAPITQSKTAVTSSV